MLFRSTIGATNVQVYCIVLLQAFLCGILGYTLGILMALGIEHLTMRVLITRFTVLIDRPYILTVFLMTMLMVLLASLLPSRKVFRTEPIRAFHPA